MPLLHGFFVLSMRRIWEQEKNVQTLKRGKQNIYWVWNTLLFKCECPHGFVHLVPTDGIDFGTLYNFPGLACGLWENTYICFAWRCNMMSSSTQFVVEKHAFKLLPSKSWEIMFLCWDVFIVILGHTQPYRLLAGYPEGWSLPEGSGSLGAHLKVL